MVCKVILNICNQPRDRKLAWVFYAPSELVFCTLNGPSNIVNDNHTILEHGHFVNFMTHFELAKDAPYKRIIKPIKHVKQFPKDKALVSSDEQYMVFATQEAGPGVTFTLDCGSSVELNAEALNKMIAFKAEIKAYFEVGINPEICVCEIESPFFVLPCSSANTPLTNTVRPPV